MDFKKTEKQFYQPKTVPGIVDVPEMNFITIDGQGDPNTSAEYSAALEMLYGLSYTIKMTNKVILEYVVPPLEGLWEVDDEFFKGGGAAIVDKNKFIWTSLIRQPDFVTADIFEIAKTALAKKKPHLNLSKARLIKITEGLCVQIMHIGSYDDEPATIAVLDKFAIDNSYAIDINATRRHHEIYLSDPRKTAAEKLKTIIRHPIRHAN
ncbi:MAG: GyrI-like domain-containing protein [Clostridiales bacterium]|nr:GyrI-like domain-containing protein [Clostridiales bacterium]